MCGLITSPRCAPALRGLPDAGQGASGFRSTPCTRRRRAVQPEVPLADERPDGGRDHLLLQGIERGLDISPRLHHDQGVRRTARGREALVCGRAVRAARDPRGAGSSRTAICCLAMASCVRTR